MWNRNELKEKAKMALKQNYWKGVFVSLIFAWIAGGTVSSLNFDFTKTFESGFDSGFEYEVSDFLYEIENLEGYEEFETTIEEDLSMLTDEDLMLLAAMVAGIFMVVVFVIAIIATAISLVWSAFIGNPVELGCSLFFLKSLNQKAEVKEVAFGFDSNYKNVVKVMFFRSLYIILWSFLLWIPGIIKSYEYRMIPYILSKNPNLTKEEAFELSKNMMNGNKWKAFVLDLSFIGWDLLSVATLGLVDIFYVAPYRNLTNAALFECLSKGYGFINSGFGMHEQSIPDYVETNPYINPMV